MENTTFNKIEMEFKLIAFFNSIGIDNIYKGTKEPELQKEYKGDGFVFKSETSHHLQTDIDLNKIKKALNNKYDFELKKDKFLKWDIFLLEQINDLETFAKKSPQIQKDYFKLIESCKRAINEVKRQKKAKPVNENLTLKDIAKPEYYETRKHYSQILDHFKLLKIRIERESNIINNSSYPHLEDNTKAFGWLTDKASLAKEEIQYIYDMGNSEAIKNTIKCDYSELKEWLKVLVNTNMFILEKTPLNGNKIAYLNTIDTFEAKAVTAYATLENMMQMFYSPILEIWNGEKEPIKYDANLWNEKTYRLFLYLCENYKNANYNKYTFIYYFINDLTITANNKGYSKLKRELYIKYIESIGGKITNKNRPERYSEIEPTLKELTKEFESKLI